MSKSLVERQPAVKIAKSAKDMTPGVLNIRVPDMSSLAPTSEYHQGTKIGLALMQALIPVKCGIFLIPDKIMVRIKEEAIAAETIIPANIIKIWQRISLFKKESTSDAVAAMSEDINRAFMFQAVSNSGDLLEAFIDAMSSFCESLVQVKSQFASQETFFLTQAMEGGSSMAVDIELIDGPIEDLKTEFNRMSNGFGAYYIVSLLTAVDEIRDMLSDSDIQQLYGAANIQSMFNRLDFKIEQDKVILHKQMSELLSQVEKRMSEEKPEMSNKEILNLLMLAERVLQGLDKL